MSANAIGYFYLYEKSKDLGYDFERPSLFVSDLIDVDFYRDDFQVSLELHPTSAAMHKDDRFSSSWGRINLIWRTGK